MFKNQVTKSTRYPFQKVKTGLTVGCLLDIIIFVHIVRYSGVLDKFIAQNYYSSSQLDIHTYPVIK